ncbi:hypothetical protein CLOSTASPAR_03707 [[Clostridium] asparagiforme DSM 15981]|uniref:Uncharacterized protein n=1 Tax=[Clostridium] asparagiforme DSM 15981 TaxID=518636 RepID=C0D366_9FIRM|nr:hypothetical protein CLOSTASPAR_03707 [[Clostridium] asparagiforme DSM 15981]
MRESCYIIKFRLQFGRQSAWPRIKRRDSGNPERRIQFREVRCG